MFISKIRPELFRKKLPVPEMKYLTGLGEELGTKESHPGMEFWIVGSGCSVSGNSSASTVIVVVCSSTSSTMGLLGNRNEIIIIIIVSTSSIGDVLAKISSECKKYGMFAADKQKGGSRCTRGQPWSFLTTSKKLFCFPTQSEGNVVYMLLPGAR
jgi:hypothetical protein